MAVLQPATGGADMLFPLPACVWFQSLSRYPTAPQLGWTSSSTSSTGAAGECRGCDTGWRRPHPHFLLRASPVCSSPESADVSSSFSWVGQSRYQLQLEPKQLCCLSLKACFLQAGVYNLSTARVFARPSQQACLSETAKQTATPALIIINNA